MVVRLVLAPVLAVLGGLEHWPRPLPSSAHPGAGEEPLTDR